MAITCLQANRGLQPGQALQALRTGSLGAFREGGPGRAGWQAPTDSRSFVCGQALLTHRMHSPGVSGISRRQPCTRALPTEPTGQQLGSMPTVPATELLHFIRDLWPSRGDGVALLQSQSQSAR